ncbi:hypothetical protein EV195_101174 [Tenacibaculum skagerrakense]|uniref:Uncharacterized protein n=1 Tax=Tenacibaculum skagerrakense TaxID=186571 RepID=A0A4R2P2T9_9FLAO|nr:hypothetical protein EV195_101174 [Tenacibaculum skagerrakense]
MKSNFRMFLMFLLITSLILVFNYAVIFIYLASAVVITLGITYINEEN